MTGSSERDLVRWLQSYLAELLDIEAEEVDPTLPLAALGVDSATTLVLAADLSSHLGRQTQPYEILEHPTVEDLTRHLTTAPPATKAVS